MMSTRKLLSLCSASMLCLAQVAWASSVTMEPAEVTRLRSLVTQDNGAAAQFALMRKEANAALDDRPNPIARVVSQGRLNTDPEKIRTTAALDDIDKVEALAWTWAVTGDARYAVKAREFINAWARVNQPDGNGINETKFEPLIEAYDLLRPDFPAAERAQVDAWLRGKAQALWSSTREHRENWQSHRLKIVGLIGATIQDKALWQLADDGFKRQIKDNFAADGASVDFQRRDALHYHLYAVQPLLTLACVAQRRGESLFSYKATNGASLSKAVEFTRPFALGQKTHVEFANSKVKFDQKRADAGEKAYSPHEWNPKSSVRVYAEAGCVDPQYDALAAQVAGSPTTPYVSWRSVLNAASRPAQPR